MSDNKYNKIYDIILNVWLSDGGNKAKQVQYKYNSINSSRQSRVQMVPSTVEMKRPNMYINTKNNKFFVIGLVQADIMLLINSTFILSMWFWALFLFEDIFDLLVLGTQPFLKYAPYG